VHGIVQTPDGYLWIATLNGVAGFDGMRFVVFDRSNTEGIDANRFISMIKDSSGALWLVSEGAALFIIKMANFKGCLSSGTLLISIGAMRV